MEGLLILGIFLGGLVASSMIQEFALFVWSGMKDVLRVGFGVIGVVCRGLGLLSAMGWIVSS